MNASRALTELSVAAKLAAAALDVTRPVLANLIVTRRCNLSCGYCHEFDAVSPPVPLADLTARIDRLAELGTILVTLTGGESLLHPDIVRVVAHVKQRGMVPLLNTNGFLLTKQHIVALNAAGLHGMQISVDNVTPTAVSKKSLKTLLPKLKLLAKHAEFRVRVASVLNNDRPADALVVAKTALELGLETKAMLARDSQGALLPVADETAAVYRDILALGKRSSSYLSEDFQSKLLTEGNSAWKCRAGARYFHVSENGEVHFCPAHAHKAGIPILALTRDHIRQAFYLQKPCAERCTQPYAHQIGALDKFRSQPGRQTLPARQVVRLPVLQ
jgi:MoaA/NifB/PqqE/SkfB family radical SAM enzyme